MSKDAFGLGNSPAREKYRRELDAEGKETLEKMANSEMRANLAKLEELRKVDPKAVEVAKLADENLKALQQDEAFLHIMQSPSHPDYEKAKRIYRQMCEDATCHLPSDPKQAAFQETMRGGRLTVPKPLGEKPSSAA